MYVKISTLALLLAPPGTLSSSRSRGLPLSSRRIIIAAIVSLPWPESRLLTRFLLKFKFAEAADRCYRLPSVASLSVSWWLIPSPGRCHACRVTKGSIQDSCLFSHVCAPRMVSFIYWCFWIHSSKNYHFKAMMSKRFKMFFGPLRIPFSNANIDFEPHKAARFIFPAPHPFPELLIGAHAISLRSDTTLEHTFVPAR